MDKINKRILFGFLGAVYGSAWLVKPDLRYFKGTEFGPWFPFVDNNVLRALDKFRELQGNAVLISPVDGAIGRLESGTLDHNIIAGLGTSHAVDVFPTIYSGIVTKKFRSMNREETTRAVENAKTAGFNAIGIYPDWTYGGIGFVGMHLGIRNGGNGLYTWSGIKTENGQKYFSLDYGLDRIQ